MKITREALAYNTNIVLTEDEVVRLNEILIECIKHGQVNAMVRGTAYDLMKALEASKEN